MAQAFREEQCKYLVSLLNTNELLRLCQKLTHHNGDSRPEVLREKLAQVPYAQLVNVFPKHHLIAYLATSSVPMESHLVAGLRAQVLQIWADECARLEATNSSVKTFEQPGLVSNSQAAQQPAGDATGNNAARDFASLFYNLLGANTMDVIFEMGLFCPDAQLQVSYRNVEAASVRGVEAVRTCMRQMLADGRFSFTPRTVEGRIDSYGMLHVHIKGQVATADQSLRFDHKFTLVQLNNGKKQYAIQANVWLIGCDDDYQAPPFAAQAPTPVIEL